MVQEPTKGFRLSNMIPFVFVFTSQALQSRTHPTRADLLFAVNGPDEMLSASCRGDNDAEKTILGRILGHDTDSKRYYIFFVSGGSFGEHSEIDRSTTTLMDARLSPLLALVSRLVTVGVVLTNCREK